MLPVRAVASAFALMLASTFVAVAQSDISGAWEVTIDSPQGAMTIDADLKQAGDDVTGTITSPMGTVEVKGKLVQDALTFNYTVPMQGQNLEISMTGKVAGETIDGIVAIANLGEVPWKAKRKPAMPVVAGNGNAAAGNGDAAVAGNVGAAAAAGDAAPAAAVVPVGEGVTGKWDMLMDTPAGQMPFTAVFTQEGEKVTGTISGPGGDLPIAGTMSGNALKIDLSVPTPQGNLDITMTGDLGPTGLAGKASTMMGDMSWSATRAK